MLELLVVLIILLMVTAAAIPLIAPALDNRQMREAARLASTFISGARSRAIQTGREVGVVLQRFEGNPYAMSLAYVEVPPPYGGDTTGAACTVIQGGPVNSASPTNVPMGQAPVQWFTVEFLSAVVNPNLLRVRDEIQFNYQGPRFLILGPDDDPPGTKDGVIDRPAAGNPLKLDVAYLSTTANPAIAFPFPSALPAPALSFQIIRAPVRGSDTPMQLPEGIVIDLMYSGEGLAGFWGLASGTINQPGQWQTNPPVPFDPIITFTPNGAVGHVGTTAMARPQGPIFLLLGRRELVPDVATIKGTGPPPQPEDKNIYDSDTPEPENQYLKNFWIAIGHQTGLVTVAENAPQPMGLDVTRARGIARTGQSVGGQ